MAEQPSQSRKSRRTDCTGSETLGSLIGSTHSVRGILTGPGELATHAAWPDYGGDRIIKQYKAKFQFGRDIRTMPELVELLNHPRVVTALFSPGRSRCLFQT